MSDVLAYSRKGLFGGGIFISAYGCLQYNLNGVPILDIHFCTLDSSILDIQYHICTHEHIME